MAQKTQQLQCGTGETAWLSHLIETFDSMSSTNMPCAPLGSSEVSADDLAALTAHLGRGADVSAYAMAG